MANPYAKYVSGSTNPYAKYANADSQGPRADLTKDHLSPELEANLLINRPDIASDIGIPPLPISSPTPSPDEGFIPTMVQGFNDKIIPAQIPRAEPLDPNSTLDKISAGVANFGGNLINGLNTPLGAASLTLGGAPKVIQKLAALGFGAMATRGAAEKLGEASVTKDPEAATEGVLNAAVVPFLARPSVGFGENIALTKGDALGIGARDLARGIEIGPVGEIGIPEPRRVRQFSIDYNPLNAPEIQPLVERGLKEAQPGNIALPDEVPAVDVIRAQRLKNFAAQQFEAGKERNAAAQATGDRVGGGAVSFAGEANAGAIPNARQAALEQARTATGELPQPPHIVDQIIDVVNNKDRLALQQLRDSISGPETQAPGMATRSQANDVTRVIDQRLQELRSGKINPENEAIRRIVAEQKNPPSPIPRERRIKGEPPVVKASPVNQKLLTEGEPNAPQERIVPEGDQPEYSGANPLGPQPGSGGGDSVHGSGGTEAAPAKSQALSTIRNAFENNKLTNATSMKAGLEVRSLDELNDLMRQREVLTAEGKKALAEKDFQKASIIGTKRQLLKEAIETATNSGSWKEGESTINGNLGERPLDASKIPEANQWLNENGPKLGIEPVELSEPQVEGVTALDPTTGQPLSPTESLINRTEAPSQPTARKLSPEQERARNRAKNIADRAEEKLAEIQRNIRSGKYSFSGVTGLEPVVLDGALLAARVALKATSSVIRAIESAVAYVQQKYPNAKFNKEEFSDWLNEKLSSSEKSTEGSASASSAGKTLDDVYRIFEPVEKPKTPISERISQAVEAFRTGFSSKFRPLDKLAEDIAKQYGTPSQKGIAGIFEQLKGASGKAEAQIYRFDRAVSDLVKGDEKDFNAYMFLRRGLDRLSADAADAANRRGVADFTASDLESNLAKLEDKLGPEKLAKFQEAADNYQTFMDDALKLQVESGRMSPEVYQKIKEGNQFYAPFKVMKYIEEQMKPEGTGAKIDTVADFTKAMTGIEDKGFRLGDMLGAARQGIALSRILAEKNATMRKLADLATYDTDGLFIKKLKYGQEPPKGMDAVNVLENGKRTQYAVDQNVADAVQIYNGAANSFVRRVLAKVAIPFRAGATALNVPFQISNILADVPRQALISKYGIRGFSDLVNYPLDLVQALYTSMSGDVFGSKNKLYLDFLDSGAAGTTVQEFLTPEGLRFKPLERLSKSKALAKSVLNVIPDFSQAIEQTSKILGVKRAMRFEGVKSGDELARKIPEAITEIRRFSGSPDFGRQGKWVEGAGLNLIFMFLNARIQGTTADLGRLVGRDGAATAAKTWGKVGIAVGVPTAYLYLLNQDKDLAEDYAKRPLQERQNYWLIPKSTFITTEGGEKIRDYWRIPKRESSKWIANMVESGLKFAEERNPQAFGRFAQSMIEDISPFNIQGKSVQERLESMAASLNPVIKAPLELATGRDMYRHKYIVPDLMKKASPEQQYTERTPELFKWAAKKMPDVAPEVFRSPLMLENLTKNLSAGLFTQLLPSRPVQGRSSAENFPLAQRFQALPFTDSTEFEDKISKLERESSDDQLTRFRSANDLIKANPNASLPDLTKKMVEKFGPDRKLLERIIDVKVAEQNGITPEDRRVMALPIHQRAQFIAGELQGASPEKKSQILSDYARKRILSKAVAEDLLQNLPDAK